MNAKPQALIFSTVWPEPSSSAAGVRQMQWIRYFLTRGFEVTLASPSKLKQPNEWGYVPFPPGVTLKSVPLNQSEGLEGGHATLKGWLQALNPKVVMFDRFLLEEQFGHAVYEACPASQVVIETQDVHFVRALREASLRTDLKWNPETPAQEWLGSKEREAVLREITSIQRVDHTFVVSSMEEKLLTHTFEISPARISWVPMLPDAILAGEVPKTVASFEEREGFCFVGNFRHAPNLEGLRWFRGEVWPRIRIRFPSAQVKIYGAYPSEEVMSWNKPQDGFRVMGHAEHLSEVFKSARVNLAPLNFGAGVKGKVLEAIAYQVPTVGTDLAFEGAFGEDDAASKIPGLSANTSQTFAEACIALHEDATLWTRMQTRARDRLAEMTIEASEKKIDRALGLPGTPTVLAQVLRQETLNYRKFFARWIEAKNARPQPIVSIK
jgi:O-antigen biosynthesis protein